MKPQKGFSMIEIAVVLVVIGMIVAGITAGRKMIHQSRLNGVMSDFNMYQTAINNFSMQYDALPGDMTNASSYWPGVASNNGNGNKFVASIAPSTLVESLDFYQHLALAGLIEGSYDGYIDLTTPVVVGTNVPASSIEGAVFFPWSHQRNAVSSLWTAGFGIGGYAAPEENFIVLGGETGGWPVYGALTPEDAKSIDKKMDDAMPGDGKIVGAPGATPPYECATSHASGDILTATYNVSNQDKDCQLGFVLEYN